MNRKHGQVKGTMTMKRVRGALEIAPYNADCTHLKVRYASLEGNSESATIERTSEAIEDLLKNSRGVWSFSYTK